MEIPITVTYGDGTMKVSFRLESKKCKTDDIMEDVWDGMNRGSRQQFPWFLQLDHRSLSVGDFITINQGSPIDYQVASFGFNRVSRSDMVSFMGEVKTRIDSGEHPWQALCEVVHKRNRVDA